MENKIVEVEEIAGREMAYAVIPVIKCLTIDTAKQRRRFLAAPLSAADLD